MYKGLLFLVLFITLAFGRGDNTQQKYDELYGIIKAENEAKAKQYARDQPEYTYVWRILSPKQFPDCNGETKFNRTLYGLYKYLGGEKYGAQVLNKETYEDDGAIEVQVLVLTYLQKNVGEYHPTKHYRAHLYRYYIENEEWVYLGVGMYVKTWEEKVKQQFAGWKGHVWETLGVCPDEGSGDVGADLWRKAKKFLGF